MNPPPPPPRRRADVPPPPRRAANRPCRFSARLDGEGYFQRYVIGNHAVRHLPMVWGFTERELDAVFDADFPRGWDRDTKMFVLCAQIIRRGIFHSINHASVWDAVTKLTYLFGKEI